MPANGANSATYRIGIDLGGTKIEGIVMADDSTVRARVRKPTPANNYLGQVRCIADIVMQLEQAVGGQHLPVGIGHPGAISKASGRIKNANSVCLNDQPLKEDIENVLGREVRMANDANCLAVSEQADGAGLGHQVVFAVILGTGVGGGLCVGGELLNGPNRVAGEWGHNPLPWPRPDWNEVPGPLHWDGRHGCIEAWLSGPGLAADHLYRTNKPLKPETIVAQAEAGRPECEITLQRYEDRLARSLATVINLLDPDVIVLGGGLSRLDRLYRNVPERWTHWVFSDQVDTPLVQAVHGDASGVRGAAWLWPESR